VAYGGILIDSLVRSSRPDSS